MRSFETIMEIRNNFRGNKPNSLDMKKGTIALLLASVALAALTPSTTKASPAEAADRAFEMAMKYSAQQFYITPSKEGHAGFATTLEFTIPVNRGLDYIFILAGDRYALDVDVWVESETGNDIVKDVRKVDNGLAAVKWRSDYNGSVTVVINFAKVTSRCSWAALVGRRGTPAAPYTPNDHSTPPTSAQPLPPGQKPAAVEQK